MASFAPKTTGHIRIVLERPGPLVTPPLPVKVEVATEVPETEHPKLTAEIEATIRSRLTFTSRVELVPEGSLTRTALKTQYIERTGDAIS